LVSTPGRVLKKHPALFCPLRRSWRYKTEWNEGYIYARKNLAGLVLLSFRNSDARSCWRIRYHIRIPVGRFRIQARIKEFAQR
jgi:hypothetical protein